MNKFPRGVNCTMLVPYTPDNQVDLPALDAMIQWYARKGCASLFGMCHSTEMHMLSMDERLAVVKRARACTDRIAQSGSVRMPVLAAGTFSDDIGEMAEQMQAVRDAGADAVIMVTNRLDPENRGGTTLMERAERLMARMPARMPLGLYECPMPYKRLLTLEELRWAASCEDIHFLKDTCCDPDVLHKRLDVVRGTQLMLFNANAQTLLDTLRAGAAGYSSVMANIHPELYAWLCENYDRYPDAAEHIQSVLCFCSFVESLSYPLVAKYVMRRQGVPVEINSRMRDAAEFTPYHAHIMDQLMDLTRYELERLPGQEGNKHAV